MNDLRVVLGIDMETDIGSWTPFYEGLLNGTPRFLNLMSEYGAHCTAFWVADTARKHPQVLLDMKSAGHEVGGHSLYHETVGESLFDIPGIYPLLPEEVDRRIELTTSILSEIAQTPIRSWRCPRLFGGTQVVRTLERLGYLCDATYPMYHFEKRLHPYHPKNENWTEEGSMKLVEIPQFADMSIDSKDPYGRDRDQWPIYRTESANAFIQHLEAYVGYAASRVPEGFPTVLCLYVHPWEFWPMPEGVIHYGEGGVLPDPFLIKGCGDYCLAEFGKVLEYFREKGTVFQTAAECAAEWNGILGVG